MTPSDVALDVLVVHQLAGTHAIDQLRVYVGEATPYDYDCSVVGCCGVVKDGGC